MAESTSDPLQVELVAADRLVWSGEASMVIARTTEGDVGVLPGHAPMLSLLIEGVVDIRTLEGETWVAAVETGFLSVANNRVSILSEYAEMSHDIDLEKARHDLERAQAAGENDDAAQEAVRSAEARIRAAERAS
ncbi:MULTISPECIES: F0F1 ATP synthase subunit epsilon [unclassified Nocardioides]|uniref:F0F1 ATP synthase subunit epsilon n=1 Tax=unclassified Nocardioides TaxID=2615069 RepID=UPI0006F7F379|nr:MULTISPECIES: F0F1 ATP synthase subunit epsilon [unclassified Nocardioides]KQY54513.1 ATP synthase subunit epsilon [Nocardioides sp. Root140]KQZ66388.1 ATP synthase subunit epsilon [Nocardioides sp. Root151]KRF19588.1 ATP synthase subunit epsilon [Nocardioides sp. Soil796]